MGSPLENWDGVEAYFTFADSTGMTAFMLIAAIVIVVGVIGVTYKHESNSYASLSDDS